MQRSRERILTTHVGSLVKPDGLAETILARDRGEEVDLDALGLRISSSINNVVRKQADMGIDIVNDGEFSKSSWGAYFRRRLTNVEARPGQPSTPGTIYDRDTNKFPDWFVAAKAGGGPMFSYVFRAAMAAKGSIAANILASGSFCTGPLKYVGQDEVQTDIANLKAAAEGLSVSDLCMTALAPPIMAYFLRNEYYETDEEFVFAIAAAMNEEYRAIADSGIVLQLDEPAIAADWHFRKSDSVQDFRRWLEIQVEALNIGLKGVPEDRVRLHTCWGSIHHPHTQDIPLENIIDLILKVNVGAYSLEASNPRHDHDWHVWENTKLPDGKILIPGVIGHFTDYIEHPRLVADRIIKYAGVVGKENVIAGVDCGLGTRVGTEEIVWAKFDSLAEGARLASKELWG
jgi:5-methyltetrahydropteroyltriglutamate--homocysteine methyltransferase